MHNNSHDDEIIDVLWNNQEQKDSNHSTNQTSMVHCPIFISIKHQDRKHLYTIVNEK